MKSFYSSPQAECQTQVVLGAKKFFSQKEKLQKKSVGNSGQLGDALKFLGSRST